MPEILVVPNLPNPTEYFCCSCRQLRLSFVKDKSRCQHCQSKDIITGPVGSLDKEKLLRQCGA